MSNIDMWINFIVKLKQKMIGKISLIIVYILNYISQVFMFLKIILGLVLEIKIIELKLAILKKI